MPLKKPTVLLTFEVCWPFEYATHFSSSWNHFCQDRGDGGATFHYEVELHLLKVLSVHFLVPHFYYDIKVKPKQTVRVADTVTAYLCL